MTFWISRESTASDHPNLLYIHYKYNKYYPTTGWNFMIRCESPSLTIYLHVQWLGPLLPSQKRPRASTWKIVPKKIKIIFQFQRNKWTELTAGTWKSPFLWMKSKWIYNLLINVLYMFSRHIQSEPKTTSSSTHFCSFSRLEAWVPPYDDWAKTAEREAAWWGSRSDSWEWLKWFWRYVSLNHNDLLSSMIAVDSGSWISFLHLLIFLFMHREFPLRAISFRCIENFHLYRGSSSGEAPHQIWALIFCIRRQVFRRRGPAGDVYLLYFTLGDWIV